MVHQRGLSRKNEQDPGLLLRDTRTFGQRFSDFVHNPSAMSLMIVLLGAFAVIVPGLADFSFLLIVFCFLMPLMKHRILPFRLPMRTRLKDYNDPAPGSGKPRQAAGIYYFGNSRENNEELWFSNEDMRTHVLVFGSTGSGKTEYLISMAYNALVQGSGFIYVDGKGDNSLFAKVFSMVRYMGRDDDMLLINFMTGARDIIGPQKRRLSNTLNPFSVGSSSMLSQLVVSMMDAGSSSADGDMWKGRAIAFVEALMRVLVCMRDKGQLLLDANAVRQYFSLERLEAIVIDRVFIRDGLQPVSMENVPDVVIQPLEGYLENLPGWQRAKRGKQVSQVFEQHGFITMQLVRVFTSLADTYGHILRTKLAEVDLKDVVLNRRILVTLLPALEKSPDELSNLGKVIIATLKAMMAAGLGEEVEGQFHDLVERKPTNATTPFLCILDEYGYYAVQGFAVVPAQARSLGFSVVFAGQDLPAFQKASKEEAASIGANTNIKICMKLEDPTETWDFFMKTAGEAYVAHVSGFQSNAGNVANTYLDTRGASIEKRARVDLLDLKDQREGEFHMFFQSRLVRGKTFYANPPPVKRMRLNQLLKVDIPQDSELYLVVKGFEDFEDLAKQGGISISKPESNSVIDKIVHIIDDTPGIPPVECGVTMLLSMHEGGSEAAGEGDDLSVVEVATDELNIFSAIELPDFLVRVIQNENKSSFERPLLSKVTVSEQVRYIERLSGASENNASSMMKELLNDMTYATRYPPEIYDRPTGGHVADDVIGLIGHIELRKLESESEQEDKR